MGREGNEPVEFADCYLLHETDKAIRVGGGDFDEPIWVPKSVVHEDSEVYGGRGDSGTLVLPRWFAEKEGLV